MTIPIDALSAAVPEVKAFLRLCDDREDVLVGALTAAAVGYCEAFTGQAMIEREFTEMVRTASGCWRRLSHTPVTAITAIDAVPAAGEAYAFAAEAYAIDIDANGGGWVRVTAPLAGVRIRVGYSAGLASGWAGVPEALRQGVVRLGAHLYTHRDGAEEGAPPAAVTALWRPWRRMPFGAAREGRFG